MTTTTAAQSRYDRAMRHALSLAAHGPITGVNPRVGCVLIDDDGTIVAEGWHRGSGTAHAEVDALSKLPGGHSADRAGGAAGLTAVVTLEPCNHHGRTGPCSEALVAAGVARVVFAVADPGEQSSGGAERLRAAGIEVVAGVLADEATEFLRRWLTAETFGRPFVTVKWASSLDGRAAAADGTSRWITGTAARQHVHEQRAAHDAIMVGTGTLLADDPALTARGDGGELLAHQPTPVVVGRREVPATAAIRNHPVIPVFADTHDLARVLTDLYIAGIRSVFVEGGPTVASALVSAGLVDDYLVYLAPTLLGGPRLALGDLGVGTIDAQLSLRVTDVTTLGDDLMIVARERSRRLS